MHNIALTWQQATAVAAGLFALAFVLYRLGGRAASTAMPIAREAGIISGLYALWQLAGTLSVVATTDAYSRAHTILRIEHDLHLPTERSVQHAIAPHRLLIEACNVYYASMHFGVMFVFLTWLFLRHRADYPAIRTVLATTTLVCLLIQLVPVAPPRLLTGFTDTASQYGQSVYGTGIAADQLSAMPSVHVAWAVLVAWAVITVSPSRWRWLVLAHPLVTLVVITSTANHFWLDGVVAVLVLMACWGGQRGAARVLAARRRAPASVASADLADAPA